MNGEKIKGLGGGAVFALLVIGIFAFIGAVISAVTMNWTAVGACLIAAAIAFSGIVNSVFRS